MGREGARGSAEGGRACWSIDPALPLLAAPGVVIKGNAECNMRLAPQEHVDVTKSCTKSRHRCTLDMCFIQLASARTTLNVLRKHQASPVVCCQFCELAAAQQRLAVAHAVIQLSQVELASHNTNGASHCQRGSNNGLHRAERGTRTTAATCVCVR